MKSKLNLTEVGIVSLVLLIAFSCVVVNNTKAQVFPGRTTFTALPGGNIIANNVTVSVLFNSVQVITNGTVMVTNVFGTIESAHAAVLTADVRTGDNFVRTNRMTGNISLVVTGYTIGNRGSVSLPGSASGGSDHTVTVIPILDQRICFHSPTNGTAAQITVSNLQTVAIEYWVTRVDGTNTLNVVHGNAKTP